MFRSQITRSTEQRMQKNCIEISTDWKPEVDERKREEDVSTRTFTRSHTVKLHRL